MYGQGNYPPQFRPPPFQQSQPNPAPPPPPFQQAPPGQQPPPISYNPPHSLIHQAPPGLPPPHYQHNAPPAPQPGPSYLHPPPQPYLPPPPRIQGSSSQMPLPYSQSSNSYSLHHVSQPVPPPPVFRLLPPPPQPQGQVLYRTPPPPPPRIQPMPTPPPPPSSGFVRVTPAYPPYGQSTAGDVFPPPPPPPPPSSPPPLPPSPPPPTSPNPTTKDVAAASVAILDNEDNISEGGHVVEGETSGDLSLPPLKPTNEGVVHNIEVLCKFMVNIGPHFENLARTKEAGNPNFSFLFGGEPGSDAAIGYEYFQWMKRNYLLSKDSLKDRDQNVSPAASDMDMEDDASQPDADKEIDESFKESTGNAISMGTSPAANTSKQITVEIAANTNVTISESTRVHQDGEDDKDSSFIEDVSPVRDSPDAVKHALENNVQGGNRTLTEDSSMIKVQSTLTEARTMEAPTENLKPVSPFRLIQGYASDDSEEDDKEENSEDSNADRISPTSAAGISGMHENKTFKSSSIIRPSNDSIKGVSPMEPKDLTKEALDLLEDNDLNGKIVECESIQKNDLLGGNNMNAENQIGKHQLDEDAKESIKLDVDEFGRIVRKGASDSDSEEMHFRERRVKRGRNRSWSRSPPQESRRRRRSRSPRRRDKRSESHSWSPKRTRSKSPPAFKRMKVSSRQDREQPPECLDFNRGRCFRGASCKFLHRDSTRHMSRQHHYPHIARDSATYDKHDASQPMLPENDAHHEDAKSIEMHAEDRVDKDASEDNAQPTGRNNIREVQVTDQITQEVSRMEESEVEDVLEAPNDLHEEERMKPLFKSFQSLQAEIMVAQSSSRSDTQSSQITQSTRISELQGPQGLRHSHQELASSHPSPSLPAKPTLLQNLPPYIGQTYSNQSPISHSNPIYISSNPNPSLPPKEFPPPRFLGAEGNFQPPQQVPPGPPGPPPTHFPSDNLTSQFGSQPQKNFPSHQPPMAGDYHSQSALPSHPVWPNIPPPPPLHSMPLRHEFNPLIRPNFHMDEFKSRPLSLSNPHEHPFLRDRFAYPPMPEGSQILSDPQREYQLRSQSFLPRAEVSLPAIKDLPFSHHPPPYGAQPPANSNYPLNSSSSGSVEPSLQIYPSSLLDNTKPPHFNPFASTFEQVPANSNFVSSVSGQDNDGNHSSRYDSFSSGHVPPGGSNSRLTASPPNLKRHGDAYDPLFDSIEPNSVRASKLDSLHKSSDRENSRHKGQACGEDKLEVDEFGDVATDAEAGAVENASPNPVDEKDWSPGLPVDTGNEEGGEIEIDQVRSLEKSKKSKDSRSMKLFKIAIAEFVKEVLKPSWRQGNMSKEAFKTIVKKTVDKVSGAMPSHQIPKSQAKINQYVESSQRKLTKLVMGYVDKYVKM